VKFEAKNDLLKVGV